MDVRLAAWNELTPVIAIHLCTALFALALGAFVLWARKGTWLHKLAGRVWVVLLATVAISSFWINGFGSEDNFSAIHLLSIYTLGGLGVGIGVMVFRKRVGVARAVRIHRATMNSLYAGSMLIAGGFTLLPGRLTGRLLFGDMPWQANMTLLVAMVGAGAAVLIRSRSGAANPRQVSRAM